MTLTSLEKSIKIIELLSEQPKGLRLSELSSILDLPQSSVHHILATLALYDYVAQNSDTKKYSLGFRFLEISRRVLNNTDIRDLAREHLENLHKTCQEAVHLAVLRNKKIVYIDLISNPSGLSLATYIGFATEPHAAAGGKVLLADLSQKELRDIYPNSSLRSYGKNTITDLYSLTMELDKVRKQGYAIDDEEYYAGVRCVAAPIKAGGKTVASLSITGSIFTITTERIEQELKGLVMAAAQNISVQLKW